MEKKQERLSKTNNINKLPRDTQSIINDDLGGKRHKNLELKYDSKNNLVGFFACLFWVLLLFFFP